VPSQPNIAVFTDMNLLLNHLDHMFWCDRRLDVQICCSKPPRFRRADFLCSTDRWSNKLKCQFRLSHQWRKRSADHLRRRLRYFLRITKFRKWHYKCCSFNIKIFFIFYNNKYELLSWHYRTIINKFTRIVWTIKYYVFSLP